MEPPAGFWLRGGALSLDIIVVLFGIVVWMLNLEDSDVLGWIVSGFLTLLYFGLLPAMWNGQTLGKKTAGVAVVCADGSPIGLGRALARFAAFWSSLIPIGQGLVVALFSRDGRAVHDYIAGTRVVRRRELGLSRKSAVSGLPMLLLAALLMALKGPNPYSVERARVGEALVFINQVKLGQERHRKLYGRFAARIKDLDRIGDYPSNAPDFGMKFFIAAMGEGAFCGGARGYKLVLMRHTANAALAPRYGERYTVVYDSCKKTVFYPACLNCNKDFGS